LVEAVTLADAQRVAARLYDADKLTVVVIGRPDGVTPTQPAPPLEG
jgi:zinc protease